MKKYKLAVVIGRFEPAHNAHFALFQRALDVAEHLVIVVGSHNSSRTIKNPWTTHERIGMIYDSFNSELLSSGRIHFVPIEDSMYSDSEWAATVYDEVDAVYHELYDDDRIFTKDKDIVIVAHNKDESTYYINFFKAWHNLDFSAVNASIGGPEISATKIRELFFEGYMNLLDSVCPKGVVEFLNNWRNTSFFATLKAEYDDAIKYDAKYENVPYGQTNFVTVDSMVVQSGHVLLVKRGQSPGKGLWALPGGHLNVNETFIQGALRELKEETNIKVPDKVLLGSVACDNIFDNPDRSLRGRLKKKIGRTITRLYVFKLDDSADLPKVTGGDDAQEAWWFTFGEIKNMQDQLFEDHSQLIKYGLDRLEGGV
jgi:bifunctional NMN adenylyltransferase/nudix hydrolase